MPFMQAQADHLKMLMVETHDGVSPVPADLVSAHPSADELAPYCEGDIVIQDGHPTLTEETGWFARFSAPGYLDRTDYIGPFPSQGKALDALAEAHDVCRTCWEQCFHSDEGCPKRMVAWHIQDTDGRTVETVHYTADCDEAYVRKAEGIPYAFTFIREELR